MNQAELFPDVPSQQRTKRFQLPLFAGRFLRLRVAYEDLIFCTLGLVLVLLAGFCLGVERGRGLVQQQTAGEQTLGLASAASGAVRSIPEVAAPAERPVRVIPAAVSPLPAQPPNVGAPAGSYAIQLVSYVGSQSAEEEARRLGRQGIRTQVIKKGKYVELRAVGYGSWADAKQALPGLRKTYRDAFIKQLSS